MFVAILSEFYPSNRQIKNVSRFSQTMINTPGVQPTSHFFLIAINDLLSTCDGYRTSLTILDVHHIF